MQILEYEKNAPKILAKREDSESLSLEKLEHYV